jgi:hypothetical protein
MIGPREAEAKVVPTDPTAQALLDAIRTAKTMPHPDPFFAGTSNPPLRQLYQQVLQQAEARPETVTVGMMPQDDEFQGTPMLGYYDPQRQAVHLQDYPIHGPRPAARATRRATPANALRLQPQPVLSPGVAATPTFQGYQGTATHELLHFLLPYLGGQVQGTGIPLSMPTALQHQVIRYLLGASDSNNMNPRTLAAPPRDEAALHALPSDQQALARQLAERLGLGRAP